MKRLEEKNKVDLKRIDFLLLPTGSLQEISLSNPWSDEFLVIADKFDKIKKNYSQQNLNCIKTQFS